MDTETFNLSKWYYRIRSFTIFHRIAKWSVNWYPIFDKKKNLFLEGSVQQKLSGLLMDLRGIPISNEIFVQYRLIYIDFGFALNLIFKWIKPLASNMNIHQAIPSDKQIAVRDNIGTIEVEVVRSKVRSRNN